eukprot:TRINITY_DN10971_c0_g1_i5.p2 TRINITY_DN10971_c0_g1~~TRINITY_DN10971_c0_g1_i5.p2  ORF type:complete len:106 (-),score=6.16 TRINITY_DN10971_c0_g1_i5:81-398(-)
MVSSRCQPTSKIVFWSLRPEDVHVLAARAEQATLGMVGATDSTTFVAKPVHMGFNRQSCPSMLVGLAWDASFRSISGSMATSDAASSSGNGRRRRCLQAGAQQQG